MRCFRASIEAIEHLDTTQRQSVPEQERDLNRRNALVHRRWVEQKTAFIRNGFTDEYRLIIGVSPEQHGQLIARLKENETTGEERWSQVVDRVKSERGVTPAEEPEWSLLNRKLDLPPEFRNMSHSRMLREHVVDQEYLLEQDRPVEYERITGISMAYHYLFVDLLEEAMRTGEQSFDEIRNVIDQSSV